MSVASAVDGSSGVDGAGGSWVDESGSQVLYGVVPRAVVRPTMVPRPVSAPLAQAESAAGEWVVDESGNPVQWVPAPVAQDAGQSQVQPQVQQQQAQEWQAPARVQSQLQAPVESYYYSDESGMHWAAAPAPQPAESAAPVPMTAVAQAVADLASAAAVQTHEAYYDDAALASQSYGFDESGAPTSTSLVGARLGAAVAAASTLTQQVAYEGQWSRMTELRDESGSVVGYVDENRWDNPGYTTVVQRDAAWNVVSTQVVNEGVNAGVESATAPVATPAPAAASPAANPPAALSIPQPQRGVDEAWAQSRQSAMGVVGDAYGAARSEAEAAGQHMVSVTVYDESGTHEKLEFDEAGFRQAWLGRQSADSFAALGQLYGLSGEQLLAQRTDVVELALSRGSSVGLYEGEPPQGRLMTNQAALDAQDQFLYSDMNVALVQLFGQGPVVPATSSLALEQVRQFGQARYEQMARITQAQQHLQADYANALEQARSNPSPQFMRQEQIQVQVGGSQDESGNWIQQPTWQTQTRQVFSVEAFSQWYTREPSLAEQQALEQGDIHANAATISRMAFGQLYGVGREIERPVVGVYTDESGNPPPTERVVVFDVRVGDSVMTLELAGDRLVQPGMVGLDLNAPPDLHDARGVYWNPLVGWMTSEQNIDHGTDLFDLVLTVIVVAVVTWFSVGTAGPAVAGLLGATAGSLAAAVVIGAVTGALTSIATGVISGNFSWKNVLKGMVLGGIGGGLSFGVQGLAQMAGNEAAFAAFDAGASTTEALAAGTQAQNLVGGLGRVAQSGLMADLGGGDMGDGLVNGLISWGGDALGDGVSEGLRQDNFSPNAVTFGGNFTRAVVAGLGADAMGGNGLQAVLSNLTGSYANQAAQEDAQRYWQQQQQQQQQAQAQLDALSNQYGPDGSGAIVEPPEQTPSPAPDNAWPTATGDASGASPAAPATTNGPSYQTSDRADGSYDLSVGPSAQQVIANAAGGSSLGEGAQVVEGWGDAWGRSNRVVDASGRTVLILDENTWDVSGGVSATYRDANWGQIGRVETSADGSQRYWVTGSDGGEQEVTQGDFQARLNTHLGLQGVGVASATPLTNVPVTVPIDDDGNLMPGVVDTSARTSAGEQISQQLQQLGYTPEEAQTIAGTALDQLEVSNPELWQNYQALTAALGDDLEGVPTGPSGEENRGSPTAPDESDAETLRLLRLNRGVVVGRTLDFLSRLRQAGTSEVNNNVDDFSDAEIAVFNQLRGEGYTVEQAARLAPLYAELDADPTLFDALNSGGGTVKTDPAVTRIRPTNPASARAYDAALEQSSGIKSADAAYVDAHEAGLLVTRRQEVERLTQGIQEGRFGPLDAQAREARQVLVAALVSKEVYFDGGLPEVLPEGVRRLTGVELDRLGINQSLLNQNGPSQSGYYAAVYKDEITGKLILANRGTEFGVAGRTGADMRANAAQAAGLPSAQYEQADYVAQLLINSYGAGNIVATGHSLGGGMASAQGTSFGLQTYTFNSAGLHTNTVAAQGVTDSNFAQRSSHIHAYYIGGELVSTLQDEGRILLMAGLRFIPQTRTFATVVDALGIGPTAAGTRTEVQAATDPRWSSDGAYVPGEPISRVQAIPNGLHLHGQSQVNFALHLFFARYLRSLFTPSGPGGK
jgi:hypothetical protein